MCGGSNEQDSNPGRFHARGSRGGRRFLRLVRTATSDDPAGPVGTYQIAAGGGNDSSHVYKLDTRTGQLWECGGVVFAMADPVTVGTGCLEIPQGFKPAQKQQ